jgi:hypothetical protein
MGAEIIVSRLQRLQLPLSTAGLVVSAVLLVKFALDFGAQMSPWLAAPFWLLVAAALGVGGSNVLRSFRGRPHGRAGKWATGLLVAAIPAGFVASSLGCMGLTPGGCSPFCTFVKWALVPLIAAGSAAYYRSGKAAWLSAVAVASFATLAPHCLCYNAANGWWIDRLGASPVCYSWGFVVSVISLSALGSGGGRLASLAVCYAIIAGATGFFITHHYFHFPW